MATSGKCKRCGRPAGTDRLCEECTAGDEEELREAEDRANEIPVLERCAVCKGRGRLVGFSGSFVCSACGGNGRAPAFDAFD